MKPRRAVRALLVPPLPEMPRMTRVRIAEGVVPGIGVAEPYDSAAGWRMYRRFHRPRPGTVDGFRPNAVATALMRGVEPEAGLVFERVVIVGIGGDGALTNVPQLVVRRAGRLWRLLPRPRRISRTPYVPLDLGSLNPLLKSS